MIDRIKLPLFFDVEPLQMELDCFHSGDWIDHFVRQNYQGEWSVIPLRGQAGATHPVMMIYSNPACREFADTPFLKNSRYFSTLLQSIHAPILAARLMKLSAGSRIKEHTDYDLSVEHETARLHIPIQTNSKVDFRLNGSRVILREGECWYLRLSDPHSVDNRGKSSRIHLVIDVKVNGWLKQVLNL